MNDPPSHVLGALQSLCRTLQSDGDSPVAWAGLSLVFAAMDDRRRSGRCREIARSLTGAPAARSAVARG